LISKPREPARLAGKAKTRVDAEKSRGQTANQFRTESPKALVLYVLRLMTTTQQ